MQPLTESQIKAILKEVPRPPGIGKKIIDIAHRHIKNNLREILYTIKLYPNEEGFNEFKDTLIESLYTSYIEPGAAVGVTAGVSIGAPTTQINLNTFHYAGAQNDSAFSQIRDFLTGSHANRGPEMYICFKKLGTGSDMHDVIHTGTFDDIMSMRPEFEQTMVQDIVTDSEIVDDKSLEFPKIKQLIELHSYLRPERFMFLNKAPTTTVLAITLDTYRMYSHRITMNMIAEAIEGPAPPDSITCIWESQFSGVMYLVVDESKDYGRSIYDSSIAVVTFLRRIVTEFGKYRISGLEGVISIEPQRVDILRSIKTIRAAKNDWHAVYISQIKTRWGNVSLGDIQNMFIQAGFQVRSLREKNKEKLYVAVKYNGTDLLGELNKRIKAAQDTLNKTEQEVNLLRSTSYFMLKTSGINMEELIWRDDIDVFRLMQNDAHSIQDMLGIDATRLFLILRFRQMLDNFSLYINARHIALVFDMLTNLGVINSLSFTGVTRRKLGPLTMASSGRALEVTMSSAIFGTNEEIVGVSPAISVGQMPKRIGTGSIVIEEDITPLPKDLTPIPTVDDNNILDDTLMDNYILDDHVLDGSDLGDLIQEIESRQDINLSVGLTSKVKAKSTIVNNTTVVDDKFPVNDLQLATPSDTLLNALKKVTEGTELVVEPPIMIEEHPDDVTITPIIAPPDDSIATKRLAPETVQPQLLEPLVEINPIVSLNDVRNDLVKNVVPESTATVSEITSITKVTLPSSPVIKLLPPEKRKEENIDNTGRTVSLANIDKYLAVFKTIPHLNIRKGT